MQAPRNRATHLPQTYDCNIFHIDILCSGFGFDRRERLFQRG
jgi:hypothetical protein